MHTILRLLRMFSRVVCGSGERYFNEQDQACLVMTKKGAEDDNLFFSSCTTRTSPLPAKLHTLPTALSRVKWWIAIYKYLNSPLFSMAHRNLCINIDLRAERTFFIAPHNYDERVAQSDDEKSIKCMMQAMQGDTKKRRFDNSPRDEMMTIIWKSSKLNFPRATIALVFWGKFNFLSQYATLECCRFCSDESKS